MRNAYSQIQTHFEGDVSAGKFKSFSRRERRVPQRRSPNGWIYCWRGRPGSGARRRDGRSAKTRIAATANFSFANPNPFCLESLSQSGVLMPSTWIPPDKKPATRSPALHDYNVAKMRGAPLPDIAQTSAGLVSPPEQRPHHNGNGFPPIVLTFTRAEPRGLRCLVHRNIIGTSGFSIERYTTRGRKRTAGFEKALQVVDSVRKNKFRTFVNGPWRVGEMGETRFQGLQVTSGTNMRNLRQYLPHPHAPS
jgi:hypothetical protein